MLGFQFIKRSIAAIFQKKRHQFVDNLVSKVIKIGKNAQIVDTFLFDPSHCFFNFHLQQFNNQFERQVDRARCQHKNNIGPLLNRFDEY